MVWVTNALPATQMENERRGITAHTNMSAADPEFSSLLRREAKQSTDTPSTAAFLEQVEGQTHPFMPSNKGNSGPQPNSQSHSDSSLSVAEMEQLMSKAGVTEREFNWRDRDIDKNGILSAEELEAAGPAAADAGILPQLAGVLESLLTATSSRMQESLFHAADTDGSSWLEALEMKNLIAKAGLQERVDWHDFDNDRDGRLSQQEFLECAASNSSTPLQQNLSEPVSLAEISKGAAASLQQVSRHLSV